MSSDIQLGTSCLYAFDSIILSVSFFDFIKYWMITLGLTLNTCILPTAWIHRTGNLMSESCLKVYLASIYTHCLSFYWYGRSIIVKRADSFTLNVFYRVVSFSLCSAFQLFNLQSCPYKFLFHDCASKIYYCRSSFGFSFLYWHNFFFWYHVSAF